MSQIRIPAPTLAAMPKHRPVAAPLPERSDSFMGLPPLTSPMSAPRKAPAQAPRMEPTMGMGKRNVPRMPPAKLPARASSAPRLDPPARRDPADPATSSNISARRAIAAITTRAQLENIAVSGPHRVTPQAASTISQLPGSCRAVATRNSVLAMISASARSMNNYEIQPGGARV